MPNSSDRSAEWYLICLAATADVVGIITFAGLAVDQYVKFVLVTVILLAGVGASLATLTTAITRWLSQRGAYYPPRFHARKILQGSSVLVVTAVLAVILISATPKSGKTAEQPSSPPTPGTTSEQRVETPR